MLAGIANGGDLVWHVGVGAADVDRPDAAPGPDDQFLIASNTKTFTAVLIMALRDEGKLSLDDPAGPPHPAGRTPQHHDSFDAGARLGHGPRTGRRCVADPGQPRPRRTGRPLRRRRADAPAASVVSLLQPRVLDARRGRGPHRRSRMGAEPAQAHPRPARDDPHHRRPAAARGDWLLRPPYTDVPLREPVVDLKAMAPCGGLASTARDLARWSGFLADPIAEVLAPDTVEEMLQPQTMTDLVGWEAAFGLGFMLRRPGTRRYAGHTGSMPGHITGVFTDLESGDGAIVAMSSSSAPSAAAFALDLGDLLASTDPVEPPPWRPGTQVPAELQDVVGLWFTEGSPVELRVRAGELEAYQPDLPAGEALSAFSRVGADVYRTTTGRERGELLRIVRGDDGRGAGAPLGHVSAHPRPAHVRIGRRTVVMTGPSTCLE